MTSKSDTARILQNMIDEAEENVKNLEEAPFGRTVGVLQRRADIDEAVKLVEELGGAPLHTVEEWKKLDDYEAKLEALEQRIINRRYEKAPTVDLPTILREAFPAPDAKEGEAIQALRSIWATTQECAYSTMSTEGDARRDAVAMIHIAAIVAPFILGKPDAPAPEPEGEALSVYEVVHALVGQDKTDTLFDRFDITSRLSPPSPEGEVKNRVYAERNRLAIAFALAVIRSGGEAGVGVDAGDGRPDYWHTVVYARLSPTETVSWHMAPEAEELAKRLLPPWTEPWDGTYLARDPEWPARLSPPSPKEVPMAMLHELAYGTAPFNKDKDPAWYAKIVTKHMPGYTVKE